MTTPNSKALAEQKNNVDPVLDGVGANCIRPAAVLDVASVGANCIRPAEVIVGASVGANCIRPAIVLVRVSVLPDNTIPALNPIQNINERSQRIEPT